MGGQFVDEPMGSDVGRTVVDELFGALRRSGDRHRNSPKLDSGRGFANGFFGISRRSRWLEPVFSEDSEADDRWFVGRLFGALSRAGEGLQRGLSGSRSELELTESLLGDRR
jgi:hypothetical protein